MRINFFVLFVVILFASCRVYEERIVTSENSIMTRILAPHGYQWVEEEENSFGKFLQNMTLKENEAKILD